MPGLNTATPFIITATLPPTAIPSATLTPIPPTPSPTFVPVEGMTTTQVNVRADASAGSAQLGMIAPFAKVQISGRDADNNWYQIQYPDGPEGKGWVTAQYVNVTQGKEDIPVIGEPPIVGNAPGGTAGPSTTGTLTEQVNVRKGPGTNFDALGILNRDDSIVLTGKDPTGAWLQIQYPKAPEGKGWIVATYVQAEGLERLPVIGDSGTVVGTGTLTSVPAVMTPTPAAALQDDDSAEAPGAQVSFTSTGTRTLLYSSDLSFPDGDAEDWVEFTPYSGRLLAELDCTGNSGLKLQVRQGTNVSNGWENFGCEGLQQLQVAAGRPYLIQISISEPVSPLAYVRYTLKLEDLP